MDKLASILVFAGIGCFAIAAVVTGYLPVSHLSKIEYQSMEELVTEPSLNFIKLSERYPEQFKKYFGEPTVENFRKALQTGKASYVAEACWHCHSQFVRPVSNEEQRFGKVSWASEYRNAMNLPHLLGTRRVGPDLIRESGKRSDDWHAVHLYDPTMVSPVSVMPRYTWFFDGAPDKPNDRGLAVISYLQWLGSWVTPEIVAREERIALEKERAVQEAIIEAQDAAAAAQESEDDDEEEDDDW
jgi:cbb3-type cytochrome oxidase cytochrome c subunit